jgi:hypothetical protein
VTAAAETKNAEALRIGRGRPSRPATISSVDGEKDAVSAVGIASQSITSPPDLDAQRRAHGRPEPTMMGSGALAGF